MVEKRRQGAAEYLKGGYCLTLLSEDTRKLLGKRPECCKSYPRGRRGAFEKNYYLTLFSEATRKLLGKRPECCKSYPPGRRGAFEGRLVPNVAF